MGACLRRQAVKARRQLDRDRQNVRSQLGPKNACHSASDLIVAVPPLGYFSPMTLFDENTRVLRDMEDRGVDLSYERTVDFSHVFQSSVNANAFICACLEQGYEARDTTDELMDHFDVTVSLLMTPSCGLITETEEALGQLATRFQGRSDGWGFFSN